MNPRRGLLHYVAELLLFLILTVVLVFAIQLIPKGNLTGSDNRAPLAAYPPPATNTPGPTVTSPPYPPPGGAAAEPTAAYVRPPLCQFGGGPTPEASGSTLDDYVFAEPQIVLTSTHGINLVEWLPDSQRVLISLEIPEQNQQTIEIFNPQTGERQVYATRKRIDEPPFWLPGLNAVVYPVMNVLRLDEVNHRYEFTRQVWVSRGDPENAQLIADNLSHFYVAVKPGENQIVYLADNQIFQRNASLEVLQSTVFDPARWEYRRNSSPPAAYEMAWRPGTSQIFLYSNGDTGGYTFLLDATTGQVCEVDLGGWAALARWSPDGRYLAIVRAQGMLPVGSSDLAVLDAATGRSYVMNITPSEIKGLHFVNDVAWVPDNRHLAVIGQILDFPGNSYSDDYRKHGGLYLVDFLSGESVQVLLAHKLGSGLGETNLILSPDGTQLLAQCPTPQEGQLCLISIQRNTP